MEVQFFKIRRQLYAFLVKPTKDLLTCTWYFKKAFDFFYNKERQLKNSLRKEHTNIIDTIARNSDLDITSVVADNLVEECAKVMVLFNIDVTE